MILVVDDDTCVREAAACALSALGHHMIITCNGKEALDICVRHLGALLSLRPGAAIAR